MIGFSVANTEFRGPLGLERPFSGATDRFRRSTRQRSPSQVQIGQTDQGEHQRGALRDSLVAHLRATELALDHPKKMLNPRAARRHPVVETLGCLTHRMRPAALEQRVPEPHRVAYMAFELVVHIAFVAKKRRVILTQLVRQLTDVESVGECHRNRMRQSGIGVGARVDLHAETPLIALLRPKYRGGALLVPVLRRGLCMDDRGLDHGAALVQQVMLRERVVDDVHHLGGQPVFFEQVAGLEDRRLVERLHRLVIWQRSLIAAASAVHGTTASISAMKRSRRVCFSFLSKAREAKGVSFMRKASFKSFVFYRL